MDAKMRTPDALRCVAANIELYYKKSAPNGAWCIAACRNAAEQFESLQTQLAESQAREKAAVKCIKDVEMYLELGSGKHAYKSIKNWRGEESK